MEYSNKGSFLNMFIMKYEDFEKYCEWLFAVLAEIEPLVPYQNYTAYQKKVYDCPGKFKLAEEKIQEIIFTLTQKFSGGLA